MSFSVSFEHENKLIISSDKRTTKVSDGSFSDDNNKIMQLTDKILGVGVGINELTMLFFEEFKRRLKTEDWLDLDKEMAQFLEVNFNKTSITNPNFQKYRKSQVVIGGPYNGRLYFLYLSSIPTVINRGNILPPFSPVRLSDNSIVPMGSTNQHMRFAQQTIKDITPSNNIIDKLKEIYKKVSNENIMVSPNFDIAELGTNGYTIKTIR